MRSKAKPNNGFRKTELGWLPTDWRLRRLAELSVNGPQNGLYKDKSFYGQGYEMVHMSDMFSNRIVRNNQMQEVRLTENELAKYSLKEGDLLFARRSIAVEGSGKCCVVGELVKPVVFESSIIRISINKREILPLFAFYFIESEKGRRQMFSFTRQVTISGVAGEDLKKYFLPIPPIEEQAKIAQILAAWDFAIEKQTKIIQNKLTLKRGLTQQLLTGKKRFQEFSGQRWRPIKISDFTIYNARVRPKPEKPFTALGIRSHGKGTFLKPDFHPSKIEMTELFEVKKNDLIVNITFAWEGAVAIAGEKDDGALVSHRFPTYEFKTDIVIPEFFRHVIVQKWFVERMGLISPGGAGRNRVLNKKEFVKIEVLLPSVDEQRRIAAVLNACDKEIELLNKQLTTLKRQRLGLMQKLLTGQIRVKVGDESKEEMVNA